MPPWSGLRVANYSITIGDATGSRLVKVASNIWAVPGAVLLLIAMFVVGPIGLFLVGAIWSGLFGWMLVEDETDERRRSSGLGFLTAGAAGPARLAEAVADRAHGLDQVGVLLAELGAQAPHVNVDGARRRSTRSPTPVRAAARA